MEKKAGEIMMIHGIIFRTNPQGFSNDGCAKKNKILRWIPAFAGMTVEAEMAVGEGMIKE